MPVAILTMSSVGQITIPRKVREQINLQPGAKLELEVNQKDNTITMRRKMTNEEVFAKLEELSETAQTPDPRAKTMTVGEMALEMAKELEGDTWV